MKNHEPEWEKLREEQARRESEKAYRGSVQKRLHQISETEALRSKWARKRVGVTQPVRIFAMYGEPADTVSPELDGAMQRLWICGSLTEGRADHSCRHAYLLIAKGRAPLTETDVIEMAALPGMELQLVLSWVAHRQSLAEALEHVRKGEIAPPVTITSED